MNCSADEQFITRRNGAKMSVIVNIFSDIGILLFLGIWILELGIY